MMSLQPCSVLEYVTSLKIPHSKIRVEITRGARGTEARKVRCRDWNTKDRNISL